MLSGLRADGICACASLKTLVCMKSFVDAVGDACRLNTNSPAQLNALTQLTGLKILTSKSFPSEGDYLDPVYKLTMLQCLSLSAFRGTIQVDTRLAALSNLRQMWLSSRARNDCTLQVRLDINWEDMRVLQRLDIRNAVFFSRRNLSSMANLAMLKDVCFSDSQPGDATSTQQFLNLSRRLTIDCPNVNFVC